MTQAEFLNALKVLGALDHNADLPFLSVHRYGEFMRDPASFLIRADDDTADRIWKAMERRC